MKEHSLPRQQEEEQTYQDRQYTEVKKDCIWKQKTYEITKIRDLLWFSSYAMTPKEIKYNLHYDDVQRLFTAATCHNTSYSIIKYKSKLIGFGNKKKNEKKSRKSETRFDWVSSNATQATNKNKATSFVFPIKVITMLERIHLRQQLS